MVSTLYKCKTLKTLKYNCMIILILWFHSWSGQRVTVYQPWVNGITEQVPAGEDAISPLFAPASQEVFFSHLLTFWKGLSLNRSRYGWYGISTLQWSACRIFYQHLANAFRSQCGPCPGVCAVSLVTPCVHCTNFTTYTKGHCWRWNCEKLHVMFFVLKF